MMVMMVLVVEMMMMMIPTKSSSMTVTISPSGKEFPRQISDCRRAFLSLSASQRRRNISLVAPPVFRGFGG